MRADTARVTWKRTIVARGVSLWITSRLNESIGHGGVYEAKGYRAHRTRLCKFSARCAGEAPDTFPERASRERLRLSSSRLVVSRGILGPVKPVSDGVTERLRIADYRLEFGESTNNFDPGSQRPDCSSSDPRPIPNLRSLT